MIIPKTTKLNILVLLFFTIVTLIITWPLIFNLTTFLPDRYDALLINWIINWVIHHPTSLDTNIFFPFKTTLAYSDFHLISALTSFPFVLLFNQPLLAANINFLLGFILSAFSTFLLVKFLTKDPKIALLCGTLFGFGTIHMSYSHHLQLFGFWPFIFTLLFFFKKNWKSFVLFFCLSVATMPLFFYFFLATFAVLFISTRKSQSSTALKFTCFAFLLSGLVFIPYFLVSNQFGYVRPITDTIHFSLKLHDFFKLTENSRFGLFTGLTSLLLLILLIFNKPKLNAFLILSLVCFILAFGPGFHIFEHTIHVGPLPAIPMPYLIFYYLLPGFSGFRTPSRWILLAFFAFVVGFSIVFKHKLGKVLTAMLICLILLEVNAPFSYVKLPEPSNFPPEQLWLQDHYQGAPLIQFPIYGWFDEPGVGLETLRMHYSTIHFHPMYNGYSGFSPKSWEASVKWLQTDFPSKKTLAFLREKGLVLVLAPRYWRQKMLKFSELNIVKSFPETDIYAFTHNNNQ